MTSANQVIVVMITERKCCLIHSIAGQAHTGLKNVYSQMRLLQGLLFLHVCRPDITPLLLPLRGNRMCRVGVVYCMCRVLVFACMHVCPHRHALTEDVYITQDKQIHLSDLSLLM